MDRPGNRRLAARRSQTRVKTAGFWEEFRTRVRAINPDAYLVGEIWDDASDWLNRGDRFDAAMNYIFAGKTLAFAAGRRIDPAHAEGLDYPIVPPIDAAEYGETIESLAGALPEQTTLTNFNLLGSHDTARSLTVAGGDVDSVVLAALLMFTHPGAPCVYYGDEIGMTGGREPASRGSFLWRPRRVVEPPDSRRIPQPDCTPPQPSDAATRLVPARSHTAGVEPLCLHSRNRPGTIPHSGQCGRGSRRHYFAPNRRCRAIRVTVGFRQGRDRWREDADHSSRPIRSCRTPDALIDPGATRPSRSRVPFRTSHPCRRLRR